MYTYMLNPMGVGGDGSSHPGQGQPLPAAAAGGIPGGDGKQYSKITGWELKLVLELCNSVSCLRRLGHDQMACVDACHTATHVITHRLSAPTGHAA